MGGGNRIWNSIVAGHSAGVVIGGRPSVLLDYNDHSFNVLDVSPGLGSGAHSLFEAPLFVDRLAGDYHLDPGFPLIDAGDGSLTVPYDFAARPRRYRPDIGADEFDLAILFLPLAVK